jgi:hypothetical protein
MRILIALLLLASTADAQVYRLRIGSTDCVNGRQCRPTTAYASAVAVGRYNSGQTVLLTCDHCFRGTIRNPELSINRRWVPVQLLARTTAGGSDLAIIGVRQELPCIPIASQSPQIGAVVDLHGYPNGGVYRQHTGQVIDFGGQMLAVNKPSISGDSGGAVIHNRQLVGIISATGPIPGPTTFTVASSVHQIQAMFAEQKWPLPRCGVREPVPTSPTPRVPVSPEVITQRGPPGPAGRDGKNGLPGPQGPRGRDAVVDYNRIEGWTSAEIERQIDARGLVSRPEVTLLQQRLTDLESRDNTAEITALRERISQLEKRTTVVLPASPVGRDVTITVVDENGDRITVPVTVPPDKSKVTIPIQRVTGG